MEAQRGQVTKAWFSPKSSDFKAGTLSIMPKIIGIFTVHSLWMMETTFLNVKV